MLPAIRLSHSDDTSGSGRDDDSCIQKLWGSLTRNHLEKLQETLFPNLLSETQDDDIGKNFLISRREFVNAIEDALDTSEHEPAANILFNTVHASKEGEKLDANYDMSQSVPSTPFLARSFSQLDKVPYQRSIYKSLSGDDQEERVPWSDILSVLSPSLNLENKEKSLNKSKSTYNEVPTKYEATFVHRDELQCIHEFRGNGNLIAVGKKGELCIVSKKQQYNTIKQWKVALEQDQIPPHAKASKIGKVWVTSSSAFGNGSLVLTTSASNIHVIKDSKAAGLSEIFRITNLPSQPIVLHTGISEKEWFIAFGDKSGSIFLLKSSQTIETLMPRTSNIRSLNWKEAYEKLGVFKMEEIHASEVTEIFYHPQTDTLISSCRESKNALLVKRPHPASQKYSFQIPKGVRSFSAEWSLHLIATVCGDGVVRTWNPFVVDQPQLEIPPSFSHDPPLEARFNSTIISLLVYYSDQHVGVWCIDTGSLIQSIRLAPLNISNDPYVQSFKVISSSMFLVFGKSQYHIYTSTDSNSTSRSYLESQVTSEGSDPIEEEDNTTHVTWSSRDEDCLEEAKNLRDQKSIQKIKFMVRQGAPFCCLPLFEIREPKIPIDLPLPSRLKKLERSHMNPDILLQNLEHRTKV